MSELKVYRFLGQDEIWPNANLGSDYYIKSEADKVIAELEDKLQAANEQIENLINSASSIMLFQDRVKDDKCAELHNRVATLLSQIRIRDERIDELKQRLENMQASAYVDSVDAGMRERRLRRALYKACANWAQRQHLDYYHQLHLGVPKSLFPGLEEGIDCWKKMERKCLKKAEEYK